MSNWRAMAMAVATAVCVLFAISVFTAGPTFRPDYRFAGTALTGFKPMGQAEWTVQNGEIVGTPKDSSGGWLLLDGKEFQDTQMYASVKCVAPCKAGFVMRAEKTPDGGMKGILMSVTENDLVPYLVKIDASGKELSREPLPAPAGRGGGGGGGRAGGGAVLAAPAGGSARPLVLPLVVLRLRLVAGPAGAAAGDNATARMAARRRHSAAAPSTPVPRRRCRPSSPRSIRRSLA